MYTLIATLIIMVCILLVLIIMIQNPKGGGLSSTFGGGGGQMMGVQKTTDFLDKGTWFLAITLLVLTLLSNFAITKDNVIERKSEFEGMPIQEPLNNSTIPTIQEAPTNTNEN